MSAVGIAPAVFKNGTLLKKQVLGFEWQPGVRAYDVDSLRPPPSSRGVDTWNITASTSLDEKLFNQKLELKVAVSRVSMHLGTEWQKSFFQQIDFLFQLEDWEEDSNLMELDAFRTFLRFIVFAAPTKLPGIAIAPSGNPVGSWVEGDQRAHIEFLPQDQSNCLLAKTTDRGYEAVSRRGSVASLKNFAVGYELASLFGW